MSTGDYQSLPIDPRTNQRAFDVVPRRSRVRTTITYCLCVVAFIGLTALAIALLATHRFPEAPVGGTRPPTPSPTGAPSPPTPPPAPAGPQCAALLDIAARNQPQATQCTTNTFQGTCFGNLCQVDVRFEGSLLNTPETISERCFSAECADQSDTCECTVDTCTRRVGLAAQRFETFACEDDDAGNEPELPIELQLCPSPTGTFGQGIQFGPILNSCARNITGRCDSQGDCRVFLFESFDSIASTVCPGTFDTCQVGSQCMCDLSETEIGAACERRLVNDDGSGREEMFFVACAEADFVRSDDVDPPPPAAERTVCSGFLDLTAEQQPQTEDCLVPLSPIPGICSGQNSVCLVPIFGTGAVFGGNSDVEPVTECFSSQCSSPDAQECSCDLAICERQVGTRAFTFECFGSAEAAVEPFSCPLQLVETNIPSDCDASAVPGVCLEEFGLCQAGGLICANAAQCTDVPTGTFVPCDCALPPDVTVEPRCVRFDPVTGEFEIATCDESVFVIDDNGQGNGGDDDDDDDDDSFSFSDLTDLFSDDDDATTSETSSVSSVSETSESVTSEDTVTTDDDEVIVAFDSAALMRELRAMEAELDERADGGGSGAARKRQANNALSWEQFKANPVEGARVHVRQSDFNTGTLRVRAPCKLVLQEDIVFNPNPDELNWQPSPEQRANGEYPFASGFALDFFAAITIESDNVIIDLNGHELRQSREHHLQQSFAQLISIGNSPFVDGEGPAGFGTQFVSPSRVVVRNGRLGFNAHHGVHGNAGSYIYLHDLEIEDYHIAGIALNGVKQSAIVDCVLLGTNTEVPVLGTYSQARFLATHFLPQAVASGDGGAAVAQAKLEELLAQALADVRTHNEVDGVAHPDARALFANEARQVDGNVFGLRLTNRGEGTRQLDSAFNEVNAPRHILVRNVRVLNTVNSINEFVVLLDESGAEVRGPAGDVLGFDRMLREQRIDALLEAQLAFAHAYERAGEPAAWRVGPTLNVPCPLLRWYERGAPMDEFGTVVRDNGYRYARNTDAMFHVNKGAHGLSLETLDGVQFDNVLVDTVVANGAAGLRAPMPGETAAPDPLTYTATTGGHPAQAPDVGYAGNRARGVVLTPSRNVDLSGVTVRNVRSRTGRAVDFALFPDAAAASAAHIQLNAVQRKALASDKKAKKPTPASAPASSSVDVDVIVGGAGYAGAAIVEQLGEQGVSFRILEASDHVGGRMVAKPFGSNPNTGEPYYLEAGANWVQGLNGNPVWDEAIEAELEGNAQNFDDITFYDRNGIQQPREALYLPGTACLRADTAYVAAGEFSLRCLQPSGDERLKSVDRRFCADALGIARESFHYEDDDDRSNEEAEMITSGFLPWTDPEPASARVCQLYSQDFEWAEFPNVTSANNTLPPNTYADFRDADYWVGGSRIGYAKLVQRKLARFIATSVNNDTHIVFNDPSKLTLQRRITKVNWDPTGATPVTIEHCGTAKQSAPNQPTRYNCFPGTAQVSTANEFVSTFSLGVLRQSVAEEGMPSPTITAPRFIPPLSTVPGLGAALGKYPMAYYSKIFFQFEHKFWDDAQLTLSAYSDGRWQGEFAPVWQSLDTGGNPNRFLPGSRIFFVTVLGERAEDLHSKTDAQIIGELLPVLNQMFGARINELYGAPLAASDVLDFSMTRWIADELFRGMYSNMRANVSWSEIEPTRQRYGNLVLSGEHSCFRYNGYTHGALLGGRRSARNLLAERYGKAELATTQSICDVLPGDLAPPRDNSGRRVSAQSASARKAMHGRGHPSRHGVDDAWVKKAFEEKGKRWKHA